MSVYVVAVGAMKAAPFDYVRVSALGHALTLGAACGLLVIASLWASTALAQSAPLLALDAPERAEKLLAGARKDGTLTLYTAFRPQDLPAIVEPFEAKYGIKVKAWRSGTNIVTQRVLREAAAKRHEVDVVMVPASDMLALSREKILQPVSSPHAKDLLPSALTANRQWTHVFMNVTVHTYNTNVLKKADLPKSYADLLEPKWKGQLGVEAKAEEWFTKVVLSQGEEKGLKLMRDIVARNGMPARIGVSLLHNLVVAGEVPLALTDYIDLPEKDKRAGKPVDWFVLEPVVAQGFSVGLAQNAPHAHAAQLFYDYMLSPETQKLLASLHYYPSSTKVANPYASLKLDVVDPVFTVDNYAKWSKLFEDTVTKAQPIKP